MRSIHRSLTNRIVFLVILGLLLLRFTGPSEAVAEPRNDGQWDRRHESAGPAAAGRVFGVAGNPTRVRLEIDGGMRTIPGELVKMISPGSIAESSGLRRGDVIVKWDGKYVGHDGELPALIRQSSGTGSVDFKIVRDGRFKVLTADFGPRRQVSRPSRRIERDAPVGAVLPDPALPPAQTSGDSIDAEIEDILSD